MASKLKEPIPIEITEYKEKFILGLTVRQLICAAGCLAITIPTGIFGSKVMPTDVVQWVVILEAIPFAAIGFLNIEGQPFEKIFGRMLLYYILPQKDVIYYKTPLYEWQEQFTKLMLETDKLLLKEEKKRRKKHHKGNVQLRNGDNDNGNE
jgi:hypothetical protein